MQQSKTVHGIKEFYNGMLSRREIQPVIKIKESGGIHTIEFFKEGEWLKVETESANIYPITADPTNLFSRQFPF